MTRKTVRPKAQAEDDEDYFSDFDDAMAKSFKPGWPDAPILAQENLTWSGICVDGRQCLFDWLDFVFLPSHMPNPTIRHGKAYRRLCAVISERFGKPVKLLGMFMEFTYKHRMPDKAWQAACWNEMLARLGYTISAKVRADPGIKRR